MNEPSPLLEWTSNSTWEMIFKHYLLTGEGYARLHRMHDKEYYMMFISTLDIVRTPTPNYMFYDVRMPDGGVEAVPYDDMFMIKNMNPKDPYGRGVGVVKALADDIYLSEVMSKFQLAFFKNRGLPDAIISIDGAGEDAIKRYAEVFNEEHEGAENAHKIAITSGKVTGITLDVNMKDLDMQEGTILIRNSILEYLRIPREIMGITENSNRATAESAQYIYAEGCKQPKLSKIEKFINRFLIPKFEGVGEQLVFRYEDVVPHDNTFKHQQAIDGWNSGTWTLDESREADGLDPLPDDKGKIFKSDIVFGYIKEGEDFTEVANNSSTDFGFMSSDVAYDQKKTEFKARAPDKAYMRYKERLYKEKTKRYQSSFYKILKETQDQIIKDISNTKSKKSRASEFEALNNSSGSHTSINDFGSLYNLVDPLNVTSSSKQIVSFVESLTDWQSMADKYLPKLENLWNDVYEDGKKGISGIYKFNNTNNNYRNVVNELKANEVIDGIINTTKDDLKRIAKNTLTQGGNVDDLINNIKNDSSAFDKERSERIVNEQVRTTANMAAHDTFKENGIKRKRWATVGDSDVRSLHKKMNGEVRNIGEPFSNGGMYPRDPKLDDDQRYGCRCEELPVMGR